VNSSDHEAAPDAEVLTIAPSDVTAVAAATPRKRRWLLVVVATLSLIVGAGGATGVLYATGVAGQAAHRYSVNVYLDDDATAEQKPAIEAAIAAVGPSGDAHFVTRAEAFASMQAAAASAHIGLPSDMTLENAPESYRFETTGRAFDCAPAVSLLGVPGVDQIQVVQQLSHGYNAIIHCQGM
jgi:hypothetical protein